MEIVQVHRRVEAEHAKFRNEVEHVEGEHSQTFEPEVVGQHIHHHIREVIVPVVNKATIAPLVIHTVQQVHETHHLAARHHATSSLPAVSMAEFKRQGGILTGREERYDFFEGEPRSVGGALGDSKTDPAPSQPATGKRPECVLRNDAVYETPLTSLSDPNDPALQSQASSARDLPTRQRRARRPR